MPSDSSLLLPPATSVPSAIAILHDHDWLIRLDPELDSYMLSLPDASIAGIQIAEKEKSHGSIKTYKVIDNMSGIPKSLYDVKVNIEIQITDVIEGVDFLVHAPLGVVQRAKWRIVNDVGEQGAWQLSIETEITCLRLLMGIVRGKGETNVPMMGKAFTERLKKESDGLNGVED
ncbi:hypothetical protein MMC17_002974 [Xylographa soralifera]|nr:hypothetical protein [Xylographa soralifera]